MITLPKVLVIAATTMVVGTSTAFGWGQNGR